MHRVYKEQSGRLSLHPRLRIILADDHVILRRGLRAILEVEPDLEIIGEATSVHDAVALARCLQPDVVITDISFDNGFAVPAIDQLHRECSGVRVIMLTGNRSQDSERAAAAANVYAYILKDSPVEVLLQSIRAQILPSRQPAPRSSISGQSNQAHAPLTVRERQVLIGIAMGYSSKRIAGNLARSIKTVEKHRFKMMHKLNLKNAAAVARFAIENGWLAPRGDSDASFEEESLRRN
jgi:DNA-binding NarL/FixJ family response regulator